MAARLTLGEARDLLAQAPSLVFHWLLSWLFSARILRCKAAATPYPLVRSLLLRRSGVLIGSQVYMGFGVMLVGIARRPAPLTIKDRTAVGPYACFITSSYPDCSCLTSHPELKGAITRLGPIVIEQDAWIGAGAKIMPGVTIGRGAVVGAGAVVLGDVEPWTVVAGVPARLVRRLAETPESAEATGMTSAGAAKSP
jgi:acetyltransferase-like isoleucine patch superfamily enzyme